MKEFCYEIVDHIATLSQHGIVSKELTIISHSGGEPKYDLRSWSRFGEPEEKMLKGVTLDADEMKELLSALRKLKERS